MTRAITIHIEMVSARSLRTCFLGSKDWIPRFPPATVRRSGSMERATESGHERIGACRILENGSMGGLVTAGVA